MATRDVSIVTFNTLPDSTGDVFPAPADTQLTMTNAKKMICMVMKYPAGAGDEGFESSFPIPQDYVSTPEVVIRYIIDGTPANVVAFGFQQIRRADSDPFDAAYEAEDIASNSTWTGYADEDLVEEIITLTPATAFVKGDDVPYFFFIDDDVHTFTGNALLLSLRFRYSDA